MKDVDNDLQVIEHDPLAGGKPVNRHGSNGMVLSQTRFNLICDCLELGLRRSRTNHEKIRERRNRAQVQDDDVFRLFVRGEFGAGFS
jgi:hypothetical protein